MENLDIYNKLGKTPENAKKTILGGRLKGFTDINPMFRIKALTSEFGPIGKGWYIEVDRQWELQAGDEIMCFVNISLYVKYGDEWGKAIHGTGGSKLYSQERNGLYASDEGYKMALTDAIGSACKLLGMSADVYWEKDGESKYTPIIPKVEGTPADTKPLKTIPASTTPAKVTVKTTTKERIEKLCEVHSLSIRDFGLLLKALQDEGKVANKTTAEMDSVEVDTMLREMDAIRGQVKI